MTSILLIYTGGTIGMVKDEFTGLLKPFNFDRLQQEIPELKKLHYTIDVICFDTPIDSSDMQPEIWKKLATQITTHYDKYDGFVILHGSDTMAFTASALSFMLEGLNKPVILTGSQLPIGIIRTDAKENLLTAIEIAAQKHPNGTPVISEVAIYFEYYLYRGNRTTKVSAELFEAFNSPNYPVLAQAGVHINYNFEAVKPFDKNASLSVFDRFNTNIATIKLFPGIRKENFEALLNITDLKAVIIETFGSGNGFTAQWFENILLKLSQKGVLLINKTQCLSGSVEQGKYETSNVFNKTNALPAYDMTFEATTTKLMYLLGKYEDINLVKELFSKNIAGELS